MNRQIRNDRVDDLFERALPVIHSAFENHYRLSEQESREAEKNLSMWFHRFVRRTGLSHTSARSLTLSLLIAACQYARSFQIWKHQNEPTDEALARVLSREPCDLAAELAEGLEQSS
ncbi:MAG: hypothetical protein DMF54_11335 [Acidobacteria bacterium]|nr:MAG: hypothetical protein DMF55_02810 [Acidobacteriota bacterium]PYQ65323.1 MAG: hypothetical protein DMF54_11335 [Acidobacteriota bacterium]